MMNDEWWMIDFIINWLSIKYEIDKLHLLEFHRKKTHNFADYQMIAECGFRIASRPMEREINKVSLF
jgi:hypothetical protein